MDDHIQKQFNEACDRVLAAPESVSDQDFPDVMLAVTSCRLRRLRPERREAAKRYIEECLPDALADADIDDDELLRDAYTKGVLTQH